MDHYVPLVLAQYDGPPRNDRPGGAGVVPEPSSLVLGLCAVAVFVGWRVWVCSDWIFDRRHKS